MAVMRTWCGCFSTKNGTLIILVAHCIGYIAGIVLKSLALAGTNNTLNTDLSSSMTGVNNCTSGTNANTWWCNFMTDITTDMTPCLIAGIVVLSIFLIVGIIAIFGAVKNKHWFLLPWIILKFLLLLAVVTIIVVAVVVWCIYLTADPDTDTLIAFAVLASAVMAFNFYLWLCVVSHFQVLRAVSKLGLTDMQNVEPFENEDEEEVVDSDGDDANEVKKLTKEEKLGSDLDRDHDFKTPVQDIEDVHYRRDSK